MGKHVPGAAESVQKVEGDMSEGENSIEVEVNCKLTVDENTANGCLWLVQTYLNSHHVKLVKNQRENGEVELKYEPA